MALFLPFRLDFINDPVGDALIEDEFVRRLIQNRLHQINRRKRKRHVLPYAEDWDPFQQWRLAGDAEAGAGYNVLFLVHEAYSLWAQTFRETTGMSKATFNGLVEEARASGLFIDELLVGIRRPKPIVVEKKFLMSILKIRQGCSFDSFGLCLGISKAVASTFFHKFCAWFSSPAKYGEYVYMPRTV